MILIRSKLSSNPEPTRSIPVDPVEVFLELGSYKFRALRCQIIEIRHTLLPLLRRSLPDRQPRQPGV